MKIVFSEKYKSSKPEILSFIENFSSEGEMLGNGKRNKIKIFQLGKTQVNVKSFKIPNAVNKVAYKFFRKSKARRSFEYANFLISKNVGTPYPIAYIEEETALAFGKSYYISEHLEADLTFRELVQILNFKNHEDILRAFTRFTFQLHEKGIKFLDHSPGNTLIKINNGDYKFFLVDLNRMEFGEMNFEERMLNFSRLTPKKEMIAVMANEYSKHYNKPEDEIFEKMWNYTAAFQEKFFRKKRLKKKLKFWKKN